MDEYIIVKNLNKSFDKLKVIKNLNLKIKLGEITCLMGPSGVGKTTLFNIMLGIIKPDSGEIIGMKQKSISIVFQEDRLIEHLNAIENVFLVCSDKIRKEEIIKEFARLSLSKEDISKSVSSLSGGMRRRVAILRSIMFDADIILMDEPFKGLDEELKDKVISYLLENIKNKTVILITHDNEDAGKLGGNICTLQ